MFVGHLGVGLGLAARVRRRALGATIGAALLLDFLLGVFVLAGWEHVIVPDELASAGYLAFDFPYSHSLVAALAWSALAAAVAATGWLGLGRGRRVAWLIGLTVFLHFVCDVLEHVRGLPIASDASPRLGLSLWRHMPWAVALELVMLAAGTALFFRARAGLPRARRVILLAVLALLGSLQLVGQLAGGDAPPDSALATTWIAQTVVLVALGAWVDR